jgi:hypothetical protein
MGERLTANIDQATEIKIEDGKICVCCNSHARKKTDTFSHSVKTVPGNRSQQAQAELKFENCQNPKLVSFVRKCLFRLCQTYQK